MKSFRLATALLCVLAMASCNKPESAPAPAPTPSITGPSVRLEDTIERLNTYVERLGYEVLDSMPDEVAAVPDERATLPDYGPYAPKPADCPGVGKAAKVQFSVSDDGGDFAAIKKWLAANGFVVTEKTVDGGRSLTGRTSDGFKVSMSLAYASLLEVALTGPCGWPSDIPGGPTKPRPKATPKTLLEAKSPDLACEKPAQYVLAVNGPPYRGAGPHPIAVNTSFPEYTEAGAIYVPDEWDATVGDSGEIDKRRVQLIACVIGSPTGDGHEVTCEYDTPYPQTLKLQLNEASYDVVVRTARTGQLIATFTIPGTESDQDSCPYALLHSSQTTLLRAINVDTFQAKLRPAATAHR